MNNILTSLLITLISFTALAADSEVSCSIIAENTTIAQGEIPHVTVTIANVSQKELILVGSLDGSDVGWRYPKCGFEILDTEGKTLPLNGVGRCGNMNMLKTDDFVRLPAGKSFNPLGKGFFGSYQLYHFKELPAGTYLLRFYYQTSTKGIQDYFGDERMAGQKNSAHEIHKLYEGVPELDLKSNELIITVQNK